MLDASKSGSRTSNARDGVPRQRRGACAALVDDLQREGRPRSRAAAGGGARDKHISRAASCCRATASSCCSTPARRSSNCRSSPPTACTTATCASAGHHHRHRPRRRAGVRDRRQRRDGEGRHLLSDDGQEAPARAGDRRENRLPCVYLVDSGGAYLPHPGRGVPRPRPLRPHLLQPGATCRPRASRRSRW